MDSGPLMQALGDLLGDSSFPHELSDAAVVKDTDSHNFDDGVEWLSLESALARCRNNEAEHGFTLEDAFTVLQSAHNNPLGALARGEEIPLRSTASPIDPNTPAFLVCKGAPAVEPLNAIRVKYQGFHNGEVWWSAKDDFMIGVVARRMSKKARAQTVNTPLPSNANERQQSAAAAAAAATQHGFHGFHGRVYTLIRRSSAEQTVISPSEMRQMVVLDAPTLVKIWMPSPVGRPTIVKRSAKRRRAEPALSSSAAPSSDESVSSSPQSRSASSASSTPVHSDSRGPRARPLRSHSPPPPPAPPRAATAAATTQSWGSLLDKMPNGITSVVKLQEEQQLEVTGRFGDSQEVQHQQYQHHQQQHQLEQRLVRRQDGSFELCGDLHVRGRVVADKSVLVKGSLTVAKGIQGQLVTPPEAADYAEWFELLNPNTEEILPGHVVQLRSPEQRVTLDTSGEGPIMVVSTRPSVAAGVPAGSTQSKRRGVLCAFIGQVPVRVRGEVHVGDPLVPSGFNDGHAVSTRVAITPWDARKDPVGTAMEEFEGGVIGENKADLGHCCVITGEAPWFYNGHKFGTKLIPTKGKSGLVLTLVRWQHNVRWEVSKDLEMAVRVVWDKMKILVLADLSLMLCSLALVGDQDVLVLVRVVWVMSYLVVRIFRYPIYDEFAARDMYIFFAIATLSIFLSGMDALVVFQGHPGAVVTSFGFLMTLSFREKARLVLATITICREFSFVAWSLFYSRRKLMYQDSMMIHNVHLSKQTKTLESIAKTLQGLLGGGGDGSTHAGTTDDQNCSSSSSSKSKLA